MILNKKNILLNTLLTFEYFPTLFVGGGKYGMLGTTV